MPPLRDMTVRDRSVPVDVRASELLELLTVAWVVSDKGQAEDHEAGVPTRESLAAALTPDQWSRFSDLSRGGGMLWLGLIALAGGVAEAPDVGELMALIEDGGAERIRRQMLGMAPHEDHADVVAAAQGGAAALDRIVEYTRERHPEKLEWLAEIRQLLEVADEELVASVRQGLADLSGALSSYLAEVGGALQRDAAASRALALTMAPESVIETVTRGIEYQLRPGIDTIRLVPSVVVRPWTLMLEDGSTQIFVYPVADEYLEGDDDTPPRWLVATYKALADERRLRILRRLAAGPATLAELGELLEVAKSTVHHHIGILRSAGLVRVSVGDPKEHSTTYSLRTEVLPQAERLLAAYLANDGREQT